MGATYGMMRRFRELEERITELEAQIAEQTGWTPPGLDEEPPPQDPPPVTPPAKGRGQHS